MSIQRGMTKVWGSGAKKLGVASPRKHWGRKQGTTLKDRLEALEVELGCIPGELDPIEGLARIAGNKNTPLDVRVDCLKAIAPYVYPKLANMTVSGDEEKPLIVKSVNVDEFLLNPLLAEAAQQIALAVEDQEQRMLPEPEDPLELPYDEPTINREVPQDEF